MIRFVSFPRTSCSFTTNGWPWKQTSRVAATLIAESITSNIGRSSASFTPSVVYSYSPYNSDFPPAVVLYRFPLPSVLHPSTHRLPPAFRTSPLSLVPSGFSPRAQQFTPLLSTTAAGASVRKQSPPPVPCTHPSPLSTTSVFAFERFS